jgi:DNA gyrase inhibitor GyrI
VTPGTKVRTKVAVVTARHCVPPRSTGVVEAILPVGSYPVVVAIEGKSRTFNYNSDELETIE